MPRAERYGSGGLLVFDTSAWNRQRERRVSARWQATAGSGALTVCPVVALELLASTRDEQAFTDLNRTLAALPQAPVTRGACTAALATAGELRGERRIPAADYLIAAAAAERSAGVLHYDHHFDALCEALGIDSVWIAKPGFDGLGEPGLARRFHIVSIRRISPAKSVV
jgi:predicted nucleic acid-binding protein